VARVFLVNPPSPEPIRTPLLSFAYLASALRHAGHEVGLVDASTPHAPRDLEARLEAFAPDLVGIHLKTLHVQPAYELSRELSERWTLVAGGPHATIIPEEPFAHGFTYVLRGEGEESLVDLASGKPPAEIAGLTWKDRGLVRHNADRGFLLDLDALASPVDALDLFDPAWYGATVPLAPGGLLSSRGCPAACTFCANNVTGRRFRYRSPEHITDEIRRLQEGYGLVGFSFLDDSFAVGHRRIRELCAALRSLEKPVYWSCTAHPSHLDPPTLLEMKSAGCGGVDIGMESADPEMLLRIGKGVTVERVLDVLRWCHELRLNSVVNLMFGWPDETDAELDSTISFMERAAPYAGGFNARGVLVPYPGTEIYDANHERFGFTRWWINEAPLVYEPFPTSWAPEEISRCYATDPALDRNFFRHPPHRLRRIGEALRHKADLTMAKVLRTVAQAGAVPAAGAR
jgi:anaerobic magnesium-protoporphyrin IX monomethyl ester cyclase